MRLRPMSNACAWPMLATAIVSLTLAGCNKLTPNGQSDTMTLLRSGSEKVCIAPEVQKTVRGLIVPATIADVPGDSATDDKLNALNTLSVSFDLTTLRGFDKAVSRATCNATVKVTGQAGKTNSFDVDFEVSPSAETQGSFIVTARAPDAKTYARELILAAMADAATARAAQQQEAQAKAAKAQLLATVTPKWLIGAWIPTTLNPALCADGRALIYGAKGVFSAFQTSGQWTLSADTIHVVGQTQNGPLNLSGTITAADPVSFTLEAKDGSTATFRRCNRDEPTTIPSMNSMDGLEVVPDR